MVLLYTLIGCSSKVSGIERLIEAEGLSVKSQVFTDEIGLNKAIANSHLTKRGQISWNEILDNIDFKKDNILYYVLHKKGHCEINEKFIKRDSKWIDIVISHKPKGRCIGIDGYYFFYKISKDIKKVGVKAFRHDYVFVEMK